MKDMDEYVRLGWVSSGEVVLGEVNLRFAKVAQG